MTLENLVFICGIGHFGLCLGSLSIPRAMGWSRYLATLDPLMRQLFWTYAAYILVINLSFGLVSTIAPKELLNGSFLAKAITLFIAIYWLARIGIQFFYFDRSHAPKGLVYRVGEIMLLFLFFAFAIIYSVGFFSNMTLL